MALLKPKLIVAVGELVWDLLPAGPRLGGAAANFAAMAAQLGNHSVCASRVGQDSAGRKAVTQLSKLGVDVSFLQTDRRHRTGSVFVTLHGQQPEYEIRSPAAWDFLELTEPWLKLASEANAVTFGTLAQREPVSRTTIEGFLAATSSGCVRLFDVNLRHPFYSPEILAGSLGHATLLKMNDAEVPPVLHLLNLPSNMEPSATTDDRLLAGARILLDAFPLQMICITRGASGSLLVNRKEYDSHPGFAVQVHDTVGAGDAFAAAVVTLYLQGAPLNRINAIANRCGSRIASHSGATLVLDEETKLLASAAGRRC